jgi:hypothetical protein
MADIQIIMYCLDQPASLVLRVSTHKYVCFGTLCDDDDRIRLADENQPRPQGL